MVARVVPAPHHTRPWDWLRKVFWGSITRMNSLAGVYQSQGRYDEAVRLFQRAFAGHEQHLEGSHPQTLSVVHDQASDR